ncbi:hypothetical protein M0638_20790 [Roseomonas sp. NAR14]|uniref:EAL domain-containing protein n=1 Tax=Roseomonas acroporae TaxID=2937791 RepID=A0A9X1YB25_9PROT|nr:hypothetical protein [Roseomonas acroporae]MCK8786813.1 hypothetical protein [Roseomonas acroporae]
MSTPSRIGGGTLVPVAVRPSAGNPGAERWGVAPSRATAGALELAELVRDAVAAAVDKRALHLRFGALDPALRRPHHRRLAHEALGSTLRTARARLFELPGGDLVAVASPPAAALETAREALLGLLGPDAPPGAVALLRLPQEAAALLEAVGESLGFGTPPPGALSGRIRDVAPAAGGGTVPAPLDSAGLARLERGLATADLSAFARCQTVCRLDPEGGAPVPLWEERRVALGALRDALAPGCDLRAAPWLRRRLLRLLDRRQLADLLRPEARRRRQPLYLPLRLASLADEPFLRLDGMLTPAERAGFTLGFAAEDILADPDGFALAGELARTRGYRLALDDAAAGTLPLLPPSRLGVDLVQLRWSGALASLDAGAVARLRARLPEDPDAIVLAGADQPAAIGWGWEAGLRLFQGRVIEMRRIPA